MRDVATGHSPAQVGPNAITQVAAALRTKLGEAATRGIFDAAGLGDALDAPPRDMVDETAAARLHRTVFVRLPSPLAAEISRDAGRRTADYILKNRLPKAVQILLRLLPPALAARVLLRAIGRHAWTFAGSGVCTVNFSPPRIEIAANPLETPGCPWHVAVFQRLFTVLVARRATIRHSVSKARGISLNRFDVSLT